MLVDRFGRAMKDLRISVTDRCNFKCFYCKSADLAQRKERSDILAFEEIVRLAKVFVQLGICKIRITGGEPMVRRNIEQLIGELNVLDGLEDLALTTNGFNLSQKASILKAQGLRRVTISLDSLRPDRFEAITKSRDFERVLEGITAARKVGLHPIKINCVLVRGFNEDEVPDFAEFARREDLTVRFIEFMPLDQDAGWSRDKVVIGSEVLSVLRERYELTSVEQLDSHSTSRNFRFADAPGRIGLIMPVSVPFCGHCSRVRVTADGKIRTCLFSVVEHDVRGLLRSGADDAALGRFITECVLRKEKGHRINDPDFVPPGRSMSLIGG